MTIEVQAVSKSFGTHLVVNAVSLRVEPGELFVLLGSSGSGKSTLLRLMAGLLMPDRGRILIGERDVTQVPPQRRGIGMVFQNYALFRHLNVTQNVEFGLRLRKRPAEECERVSNEYLELVGLAGLGSRYPDQLSGGQRQRVALARALAYNPSVLLLDEPFGALDVKIRARLRSVLKSVQRHLGITTVLVTHDQEEAFELGDRIGVIERGGLLEIAPARQLYHAPRSEFVATFVGGGNVLVGLYDSGSIKISGASITLPAGSPKHDQGAPVRILFRPEDVEVSPEPFQDGGGINVLGRGVVKERIFTGASERVRCEMQELEGVRPPVAALSYGQRFALVEAALKSRAVQLASITVGDSVWLGVRDFHVLSQSSLRMLAVVRERATRGEGVRIAAELAHLSHGTLTVLLLGKVAGASEDVRERVEAVIAGFSLPRGLRYDAHVRSGDAEHEIPSVVQEFPFDLVAHELSENDDAEIGLRIARKIFAAARVPLLLIRKGPAAIRKILICTAGGEPGKSDVRFGARVARHSGAAVTVLHVRRQKASEQYMRQIDQHMAQAHAMLSALSVPHETMIRDGALEERIVGEITEKSFDLVVLGGTETQVEGRESKLRSVVEHIIDHTGVPVLLVPMAE